MKTLVSSILKSLPKNTIMYVLPLGALSVEQGLENYLLGRAGWRTIIPFHDSIWDLEICFHYTGTKPKLLECFCETKLYQNVHFWIKKVDSSLSGSDHFAPQKLSGKSFVRIARMLPSVSALTKHHFSAKKALRRKCFEQLHPYGFHYCANFGPHYN